MPLPEIKKEALKYKYFPTDMQVFIFRNWETVDKEIIAKVLGTTVENVECEAVRMGLSKEQKNIKEWTEKGYITTIRNNWHLLPYEQLTELLGWDEEKLAMVLKEEDFLDIKMGSFKPQVAPVKYIELTDAQVKETEKIKNAMTALRGSIKEEKDAFDFWSKEAEEIVKKSPATGQVVVDSTWVLSDKTENGAVTAMADRFIDAMAENWGVKLNKADGDKKIELSLLDGKKEEYHEILIKENLIEIKAGTSAGILRGLYRLEDLAKVNGGFFFDKAEYIREPRFGARYIYSFCGLYDGALDVDSREYCPDSLLEQYARTGVNGIWLQGVLYRVVEFKYAPEMSDGWEKRLENLKNFADRAEKYGIRIFMYINEPRSMPLAFFEKYPEMKGAIHGQYACMCVSAPETQKYLYDAIEALCKEVPNLGGLFTITMSENLTHCKSRAVNVPCERCKNVRAYELVKTVNGIVAKAAHSVNPTIKVIAWDWSWGPNSEISDEEIEKMIKEMPEDVIIMAKRETAVPYTIGGVSGTVSDYSIAVEGISAQSQKEWKWAKESNHEIAAKVQINCSWECSTTPYIPVYRTLYKHLGALLGEKVDHLMLSWTLGGYPSPSIRMMAEAFFIENGNEEIDFDKAMEIVYGDKAEKIKSATDKFCEAFSEFPFHIGVLYDGPQNGGASNILYHEPTGYTATMTCYAYDDLESWRTIYPADVFENQLSLVSKKWEEGMKLLSDEGELSDISYISYSLFRASYNQVRFIQLRDAYIADKNTETAKALVEVIKEEKAVAEKVYEIMCRRPEVGFEAANHYYYSKGMIAEKIINCNWLIEYYS